MKLANSAHTSRTWRIHAVATGFRLEDVWALPMHGDRDDFPRVAETIAALDPTASHSSAVRVLFEARMRIGRLLGWDGDGQAAAVAQAVPTLRDRLPADLRDGPAGPAFEALPFNPLFLTDDEWAAELANRTMHGILHVGWVPDGAGRYCAQLAIYVKPNGLFGQAYMAAIRPFRYYIVYPRMMGAFERAWAARTGEPTAPPRHD